MTTEQTMEVLKLLPAAYVHAEFTDQSFLVYYGLLYDIDPADLRMAVMQAIAENKFPPSPAEILDMHRRLTGALIDQTPGEAWGSVERAMWREGRYRVPGRDFHFRNPLTQRVIDNIGWVRLCMSENISVERNQFVRMYEDLAKRSESYDRMLPAVKDYFQRNVTARLAERSRGRGIEIELKRLGLTNE